MAQLLSVLYCSYLFVTAAMLFLLMVLLLPFERVFDPQRALLHYLTCLWGFHFVRLNPFWKCRIEGAQNLERGQRYVIVANHQSLADIFVLAGLRHHFKWVSKESLMRIPFFGWNMRLNEYIAIKRGDIRSIKEMMSTCKHWLMQGVSIMMFPEGTRSETGEIGHFRDGSFRLALDCDVPVIPVVISGTREVISKHGRCFNFGARMTIRVLPPVLPGPFMGSSGKMRDHVHQLMKRELDNIRQEESSLLAQPAADSDAKMPELNHG